MRHVLSFALCLLIAACGTTIPAPVAQQTNASGSSSAQVNAIRANAKRPALKRSSVLDAAARAHAKDMVSKNFFGHRGSNGSKVGNRVEAAGYRWCSVAENISKGYPNRKAAIEGWRLSKGHYRNLVNGTVREFGLANAGDVWVMVLAAQRC